MGKITHIWIFGWQRATLFFICHNLVEANFLKITIMLIRSGKMLTNLRSQFFKSGQNLT
jgi:hypothetical protein